MFGFGIMTLNMESEAAYIDDMARLAGTLEMEVFRFIPSQINPHTLQVKGKKFNPESGAWMESLFQIPEILYDRCFYGDDEHSKQCMPIVNWLKSRNDIKFVGYGLPNKMDLYEVLKNSRLSAYIPASMPVPDSATVLDELKRRNKLILKPVNGSQGYGIFYIKQNDKTFYVKTEKQKKVISRIFPNETKLSQWIHTLVRGRPYLMQPYLELTNEEMQPFDIRILLQKDETANWVTRGKGVRKGSSGGILSNLAAGGIALNYSDWIKSFPATQRAFIRSELDYIISQLPPLLEKEFMPLFELGVDIGVAKDGSVWILDVNSKPGRKVILETKPTLREQLSIAPLLYGKYLSQTDSTERKNFYAKTLSH